jgi:hypothetical protein
MLRNQSSCYVTYKITFVQESAQDDMQVSGTQELTEEEEAVEDYIKEGE